jgi:phosphoribosylglycinamide formyltransferase-1
MKKIAIFASGNGSNAENIVLYFREKQTAEVILIVSNNPMAIVLERALKLGVESKIIAKEQFQNPESLLEELAMRQIDLIVLAGFLWLVPPAFVRTFPQRILNIHPALLPKYGGKGMYGNRVHQAVSVAGETESGITIHFVNESYDEGDIVFQKKTAINFGELPEIIAQKIHQLEHAYYPKVIEEVLKRNNLHSAD